MEKVRCAQQLSPIVVQGEQKHHGAPKQGAYEKVRQIVQQRIHGLLCIRRAEELVEDSVGLRAEVRLWRGQARDHQKGEAYNGSKEGAEGIYVGG